MTLSEIIDRTERAEQQVRERPAGYVRLSEKQQRRIEQLREEQQRAVTYRYGLFWSARIAAAWAAVLAYVHISQPPSA